MDFDQLVAEAMAQDFSGWDFSWLRGRWSDEEPYWVYRRIVRELAGRADSLLDMGTGGGEFLASLDPLPAQTFATESYPPNIPVARGRLEPLGVTVVAFEDERALPLPDETFELIINRQSPRILLDTRGCPAAQTRRRLSHPAGRGGRLHPAK